jgi:hypothetical protein
MRPPIRRQQFDRCRWRGGQARTPRFAARLLFPPEHFVDDLLFTDEKALQSNEIETRQAREKKVTTWRRTGSEAVVQQRV